MTNENDLKITLKYTEASNTVTIDICQELTEEIIDLNELTMQQQLVITKACNVLGKVVRFGYQKKIKENAEFDKEVKNQIDDMTK